VAQTSSLAHQSPEVFVPVLGLAYSGALVLFISVFESPPTTASNPSVPAQRVFDYAVVRGSGPDPGESTMCRNIKTLFNFDPPATDDEVREASLQFVRKLSGFTKPSRANEAAFHRAVKQMTEAARNLLDSLVTDAEPRNREVEAARARARAAERFGSL